MTYGVNSTYHGIKWLPDFSAPDLFKMPEPIKNFDKAGTRKKVCVIGAGLAGLAAAYELSQLGHDVSVLEASNRAGGRVYTYRFRDSMGTEVAYGELGAMRIPEDHCLVRKYASDFGIQEQVFVSENENAYLYFEGTPYRRAEWEKLRTACRRRLGSGSSSPSGRPDNLSEFPDMVLHKIAKDAKDILPKECLWGMFGSSFDQIPARDPKIARGVERLSTYENMTLWQYLTHGGTSLTPIEWEIIGRISLNLPFERAAFTQWLINNVALQNPNKYELEGGMSRLTEALEHRISPIKFRHEVIEVSAIDGEGMPAVRVRWRENKHVEKGFSDFDYVICAAPAPAAARISFPQMTSDKFEALTNLTYLPSAKALILCDRRWWELGPDKIFGGASYTDLGTQQSWYPSDNARPLVTANGGDLPIPPHRESQSSCGQGTTSEDRAPRGTTWEARDPNRSNYPGAFLAAYMYGPTAQHFASLSDDERRTYVIQNVSRYHTWLDERVVQEFVSYSWDDHSSPGGGAYAFFAPGEFSRYQRSLESPLPGDHPRIFFAGEHVAVLHAWMQSALQSGVSAARRVAMAPPPA